MLSCYCKKRSIAVNLVIVAITRYYKGNKKVQYDNHFSAHYSLDKRYRISIYFTKDRNLNFSD